jgi:pilus assembly protein Flp/PilA
MANWETGGRMKFPNARAGVTKLRRFLAEKGAATAIEYGLMAALISLAIIGTVEALGQSINTVLYGNIVAALASMSK